VEKRLLIEELMRIDSRNSFEDSVEENPYKQQTHSTIQTNRDPEEFLRASIPN
jgi:hypothetical protein